MNKEKNKKNKKGCIALYLVAGTMLATAAVIMVAKERKRMKAEKELLSYEVW